MIHPSKLGSWARCPKRAWHDLDHGEGLGAVDIASWVGTAAHAAALDMVPPAEPTGYILFDSTTPNMHVARQQAQKIALSVGLMLAVRGLRIVERERAVEDESIAGTLDMLLSRDVGGGREIADLKTGRAIPTGAWLQLGAYWAGYDAEHPGTVETVAVLHVPRTPLGRDEKVYFEQRAGRRLCRGGGHPRGRGGTLAQNVHVGDGSGNAGTHLSRMPGHRMRGAGNEGGSVSKYRVEFVNGSAAYFSANGIDETEWTYWLVDENENSVAAFPREVVKSIEKLLETKEEA